MNESLCEEGECCDPPCEACQDNGALTGGSIDVAPDPVCIGDTITFTVSDVVDEGGIMRVDCSSKREVPPVTPDYTWVITRPDGSTVSGSRAVATVVADQPADYSCTFTASAWRECRPPDITIGPENKTLTFTATLTRDPTSISARTSLGSFAPLLPNSISEITVTWEPPECEGTLEIVDVTPVQGYQPPGNGSLEELNRPGETVWKYTSFDEPGTELHPKLVEVWIGALHGDVEVTRVRLNVYPVHDWWILAHQHAPGTPMHAPTPADYSHDYEYLTLKYANVLGTTGGAFWGVSITDEPCVSCAGECVAACTTVLNEGKFSASAFNRSENAAASTIGHELVHTLFLNNEECDAYTWEWEHQTQTGIDQDDGYLLDVQQRKAQECGE